MNAKLMGDTQQIRQKSNEFRSRIKVLSGEIGKERFTVQIDEWNEIPVKTGVMTRISTLDGECHRGSVLNVIFKAGGRLSEHTHDDSEEVIFCLEGEYIDLVNRVRLRSGEIQVIPKGQLHSGYSPLGCKLTILWKPPLKLMENKN